MNKKDKKTIMIVDDSRLVTEMLKNLLSDVYDIFAINNPVDCLKTLAATTPKIDLGLIDVEMPDMDGFQLIKKMKKHPSYANVPFIMVTSKIGKENVDKAILAGAVDYMVKPVDKETLLQKIQKQLGDEQEQKDVEDTLSQWGLPDL